MFTPSLARILRVFDKVLSQLDTYLDWASSHRSGVIHEITTKQDEVAALSADIVRAEKIVANLRALIEVYVRPVWPHGSVAER